MILVVYITFDRVRLLIMYLFECGLAFAYGGASDQAQDIVKQYLSPYSLPFSHSMRSILRNHRYRRDARTLEDEEEMWFNTDEDDMEDGEAVVSPSDKTKNDDDIMDPISKFMERKKCMLKQRARETEALSPGPSFLEKMISGYCEYMISQRLTGCG